MRAVDEGTNRLHGDVERDDDHRERDPGLRPPFESFCRDGVVALRSEAPDEHDRRGRVEQRGQGEPGQGQTAVEERDDKSSDADGTVPRDREVREPERGYDEFGAVADRPQPKSVGGAEGAGSVGGAEVVYEGNLVGVKLEHTDLRVHEADDVGGLGRPRERSEDAADCAGRNVAAVVEQANGVVHTEWGGWLRG